MPCLVTGTSAHELAIVIRCKSESCQLPSRNCTGKFETTERPVLRAEHEHKHARGENKGQQLNFR